MSQQIFEDVVTRLTSDGAFRSAVLANPEVALANFDLSPQERELFAKLDASEIDGGLLDERISKGLKWSRTCP